MTKAVVDSTCLSAAGKTSEKDHEAQVPFMWQIVRKLSLLRQYVLLRCIHASLVGVLIQLNIEIKLYGQVNVFNAKRNKQRKMNLTFLMRFNGLRLNIGQGQNDRSGPIA